MSKAAVIISGASLGAAALYLVGVVHLAREWSKWW